MSYDSNKAEVLSFFENHILKYIVKDLEVLDDLKADDSGAGGCAIPQASATFSALDLMGYLTHPHELRVVNMSFSDFLNNETYFPSISQYKTHTNFLKSLRDDVRSIMAHRFSLTKYDITKEDNGLLFYEEGGKIIFNTSHFTKITISVIKSIDVSIRTDTFLINGFDKEATIEKMKMRMDSLKNYESDGYATLTGLQSSSISTQTTSSLG